MKRNEKTTNRERRNGKNRRFLVAVALGAALLGGATLSTQLVGAQEVEKNAPERPEPSKISPEEAEKIEKEIDQLSALQYQAKNNHEYDVAIRAGERVYELTLQLEEANARWRDEYVKRVADGITESVKEEEKDAPGVKRVRRAVGPSKPFLLQKLGAAYGFLGEWEKAEEYYRRAGLYEPEKAKFYLDAKPRAQVAFARGRFDEAFDVVCAAASGMLERIVDVENRVPEKAAELEKRLRVELWSAMAEVAKPLNFFEPKPWPADTQGLLRKESWKEADKKWKARYNEIMKTLPKTPDERFVALRANFDELMEKVVESEFKRRGEPEEFRAEVELLREIAAAQYELGDAFFKRNGGAGLTQTSAQFKAKKEIAARKVPARIVLSPDSEYARFGSTYSGRPTLGSERYFNALSQGRYDETIEEIVAKIEKATFWRDEFTPSKNGVYTGMGGARPHIYVVAEDFRNDVVSLAIACELSGRYERALAYYSIVLKDGDEIFWARFRNETVGAWSDAANRNFGIAGADSLIRLVAGFDTTPGAVSYDALERLVERAKTQNVVGVGRPVHENDSGRGNVDSDWRKVDRLKTYAALVVCPELFFAVKGETREEASEKLLELRREKFAEFLTVLEATCDALPSDWSDVPNRPMMADPPTKGSFEPTLRYFRKLAELP